MEKAGWAYTARNDLDFDVDAWRVRMGYQTDFWRLQRHLGRAMTIDDVRRFAGLPEDDKRIIVARLRELAGFAPDAEIPRIHDPVVEVYHDGEDFIERIAEDPDAGDFDHAPPRPR
jgi:hypothetical protein